jgi:hypothetical protein
MFWSQARKPVAAIGTGFAGAANDPAAGAGVTVGVGGADSMIVVVSEGLDAALCCTTVIVRSTLTVSAVLPHPVSANPTPPTHGDTCNVDYKCVFCERSDLKVMIWVNADERQQAVAFLGR